MNIIPAASLLLQSQELSTASAKLDRYMSTGQLPATPVNKSTSRVARRRSQHMAEAFASLARHEEAANDEFVPRSLA